MHINVAPFYVMLILVALGQTWSWPQAIGPGSWLWASCWHKDSAGQPISADAITGKNAPPDHSPNHPS